MFFWAIKVMPLQFLLQIDWDCQWLYCALMLHYRVHRHMQETSSHYRTKSQCGMLCLQHIGHFFWMFAVSITTSLSPSRSCSKSSLSSNMQTGWFPAADFAIIRGSGIVKPKATTCSLPILVLSPVSFTQITFDKRNLEISEFTLNRYSTLSASFVLSDCCTLIVPSGVLKIPPLFA